MGLSEAVKVGFSNYTKFRGRAIRSEYWYLVLFCMIVSVAAIVADHAVRVQHIKIAVIWQIIAFSPMLSAGIRRLHDTDRSGWWMFLLYGPWAVFITLPLFFVGRPIEGGWLLLALTVLTAIAGIVMLVWMCQPGTAGRNRFG